MFLERFYKLESETLSKYAQLSIGSLGRQKEIAPCGMRTCYQRDYDRILHSKCFRRLKHKTQVFFAPEGDHYRTRLTHTLEVCQIARTIARLLRLNENLTEAIALGHDLGHTPFGHSGERALFDITKSFQHNEHGLRVVEVLEDLNLTYEVRDGILNHKSDTTPQTLEGMCVSLSDRIAYINHDFDDALRAKIIQREDLPKKIGEFFGATHGERISNMIEHVVMNSLDRDFVSMDEEAKKMFEAMRSFMFETVYKSNVVKGEEERVSVLVAELFEYFSKNPEKLPQEMRAREEADGITQCIVDYIAGMTDRYAVSKFQEIFIPRGWRF